MADTTLTKKAPESTTEQRRELPSVETFAELFFGQDVSDDDAAEASCYSVYKVYTKYAEGS